MGTEIRVSPATAAQRHALDAQVVKALNNQAMEASFPKPADLRADGIQFIVGGNDAKATALIAGILRRLGSQAKGDF